MKILKTLFFLSISVLISGSLSYSQSTARSITVAGFINKGAAANANINTVITKSMILFLSKIPGVAVTPFEEVRKTAEKNNYWKTGAVNADTALSFGLSLNTKLVITGDYQVDNKKSVITINILVYDTVMGDLKLKRQFKGNAGPDIFDTIDKMIQNTTFLLLGKTIVFGKLKVNVDSDKDYRLFENGVFQKVINKKDGFLDTVVANEAVEVSIRIASSGKEVYRQFIKADENKTFTILYKPSGTITVKSAENPGAKVVLDKKEAGQTDENGDLVLNNVTADVPHTIEVFKDGKSVDSKTVSVREGESSIQLLQKNTRSFYFPVRLLQGGLGGTAGFEYRFTEFLAASVMGGAVYSPSTGAIVPVADADLSFTLIKAGDFRLNTTGSAFFYFTAGGIIASPVIKLEIEWNRFFIEGGPRYSFEGDGGGIKPMIGIGFRI